MRTELKRAFIVFVVVAAFGTLAFADVAATLNPGAIQSGYPIAPTEKSIGWRFFVDEEITITHLGLCDDGDNGLATTHTMGIWRVNKTGGLTLTRQMDIGPGGTTEDHHVYVDIEDLTIVPDPVPWIHPDTGVAYYERWIVGVWTPPIPQGDPRDGLIIRPRSAATQKVGEPDDGLIDAEEAGVITIENYTSRAYAGVTEFPGDVPNYYGAPWGVNSDYDYFGVNFKYELPTPVAEAGEDMDIYSSEQVLPETIVAGIATDAHPGPEDLTYRWLEGETVLQDWANVGPDDAANLYLESVPNFPVGAHTLTLEVTDGQFTVSDTMTLTISNSPPEVQLAPSSQTVEIGVDPIVITANVADFDGDDVSYEWLKDGNVLDSGIVSPPVGGDVAAIPDLDIDAGDPRFLLGSHVVQLVAFDGVNELVNVSATVEVTDSTGPTLAPTPSVTMLWPPNHTLRSVTITANAEDNGGGAITLDATVASSEPADEDGDGSTEVDCYLESIDQENGTILVQLRAERSGSGDGRVYTITVIATDASSNQSTAIVEVRVPHDQRKKK